MSLFDCPLGTNHLQLSVIPMNPPTPDALDTHPISVLEDNNTPIYIPFDDSGVKVHDTGIGESETLRGADAAGTSEVPVTFGGSRLLHQTQSRSSTGFTAKMTSAQERVVSRADQSDPTDQDAGVSRGMGPARTETKPGGKRVSPSFHNSRSSVAASTAQPATTADSPGIESNWSDSDSDSKPKNAPVISRPGIAPAAKRSRNPPDASPNNNARKQDFQSMLTRWSRDPTMGDTIHKRLRNIRKLLIDGLMWIELQQDSSELNSSANRLASSAGQGIGSQRVVSLPDHQIRSSVSSTAVAGTESGLDRSTTTHPFSTSPDIDAPLIDSDTHLTSPNIDAPLVASQRRGQQRRVRRRLHRSL